MHWLGREIFHAIPRSGKTIVQKRLNPMIATLRPSGRNQMVLLLDQSLILAMEDEARWMIANNLTDATTIPDFRKYISTPQNGNRGNTIVTRR
jgi:hypothetical protein